eukprot:TRINITY_DN6602_c0_g1_i2.p1 TRINITY_DN6602_c0_g1~~TRINITY_DN6602_c0_g1_i2.p1  ORF type:complete len:135 (-),score=27.30 TRINITY_DN6602_c0_g1_i2:25-429(-)
MTVDGDEDDEDIIIKELVKKKQMQESTLLRRPHITPSLLPFALSLDGDSHKNSKTTIKELSHQLLILRSRSSQELQLQKELKNARASLLHQIEKQAEHSPSITTTTDTHDTNTFHTFLLFIISFMILSLNIMVV